MSRSREGSARLGNPAYRSRRTEGHPMSRQCRGLRRGSSAYGEWLIGSENCPPQSGAAEPQSKSFADGGHLTVGCLSSDFEDRLEALSCPAAGPFCSVICGSSTIVQRLCLSPWRRRPSVAGFSDRVPILPPCWALSRRVRSHTARQVLGVNSSKPCWDQF